MPKYSRKYATEDLDGALAIAALQDAAEHEGDPEAQKILSEGDYGKILSSLKNLRNIETLKSATTPSPISAVNSAGTSSERKVNTDDPNASPVERLIRNTFGISPDSWKGMEKMADYKYGQGGLQHYLDTQPPDSVPNRLHSAALAAGEAFMPGPGKLRYALPLLYGAYNYMNPPQTSGGRAAQEVGVGSNILQQLVGPKLKPVSKLASAGANIAYNALTGAAQAGAQGAVDKTDTNPLLGAAISGVASIPGALSNYGARGPVGDAIQEIEKFTNEPNAAWGLIQGAAKSKAAAMTKKGTPSEVLNNIALNPYGYFGDLFKRAGFAGAAKDAVDSQAAKDELMTAVQEVGKIKGGKEALRKTFLELVRAEFGNIADNEGPELATRFRAFTKYGENKKIFDKIMGYDGATEELMKFAKAMDTRKKIPEPKIGGSENRFWVSNLMSLFPTPSRELRKNVAGESPVLGEYFKSLLENPLHGATARIATTEALKSRR